MKDAPPRDKYDLILRRTDQFALAIIVALSLLGMIGSEVWQHVRSQGAINIDSVTPVAPVLKIDINSADWPELTLIPGIGERLAKRIISARDECGGFDSIEQLELIPGIGPRKVDEMRRFCRPVQLAPSRVEFKPNR